MAKSFASKFKLSILIKCELVNLSTSKISNSNLITSFNNIRFLINEGVNTIVRNACLNDISNCPRQTSKRISKVSKKSNNSENIRRLNRIIIINIFH